MKLFLLLLVSASLGIVGSADAASWSTPATVSQPHTFAGPPTLTQGSQSVLATWGWQDGTGIDAPTGFSSFEAPLGSGFGAEARAPGGIVDIAPNGPRRAVAVTQTDVPRRSRGVLDYQLGVTFADRGRFGSLHRLVTAPVLSRASIASNGGIVIVGWVEFAGKRRVIKVVTRAPGGSFAPPITLSGRGQSEQLDVAANRRGDLAVVFLRNAKVLARVKRAGHAWGPIRELASADGATKWQLSSAISESGRVAVAWRRYTLRHAGVPGVRSLEATHMAAGRSTFSAPQVVDSDGVVGPALLALPSSTAFALSWTDQDGITLNGPATAKVALTGDSPRFASPLAASSAVDGLRDVRVAAGPHGLYAVWVEPQPAGNSDGFGRGALLPAGAASFLASEQVTPSENVHEVAIAADVSGDAFVAAWSARPAGTGAGVPIAQLQSLIRTARRTG